MIDHRTENMNRKDIMRTKIEPMPICQKIAESIKNTPSEWKYKRRDKSYFYFPSLCHKTTGVKVSWTHPLYFAVIFQKEEILKLFGWDTTDVGNSVQGLPIFGNTANHQAEPLCNILVEGIRENFNLSPLFNNKVSYYLDYELESLETVFMKAVKNL